MSLVLAHYVYDFDTKVSSLTSFLAKWINSKCYVYLWQDSLCLSTDDSLDYSDCQGQGY